MALEIPELQLSSFKHLLEHRNELSHQEINRIIAEFNDLAAKHEFDDTDPLYLEMQMESARQLAINGNLPAAMNAFQDQLKRVNRYQQHDWERRLQNSIAMVHKLAGRYFESIEIWEQLLNGEISVQDRVLYLTNLGSTYAQVLKTPKATEAYFSALKLLHGDSNPLAAADIYNNLGNIHRVNKNFDKAKNYYNKALGL